MSRRDQWRFLGVSFVCVWLFAALAVPDPAGAQVLRKVKDRLKHAAEEETLNQLDDLVRGKIRCVFSDHQCIRKAERAGEEYILTDEEGGILLDEEGYPISDVGEAEYTFEEEAPAFEIPPVPYDFVSAGDVLFFDDFTDDAIGDFPHRLTFRTGNWDVIELDGKRYVRNSGPSGSAFEIPLPSALTERFTIEFDAYFTDAAQTLVLSTSVPPLGETARSIQDNLVQVGVHNGTGIVSMMDGVSATNRADALGERPVPVQILVEGPVAKVYVDGTRVANVPNAVLQRSDRIYVESYDAAGERESLLIGPIRVAGEGGEGPGT